MRFMKSVLGAVVLGAMALPSVAMAQAKVAIANTAKILNDIQETKDLNQKISNDLKTLDAERQTRQQKVTDAQAARDQLKPDVPQWADRNKEMLQLRIEFEIWAQMQQMNLQTQQKQQMRTLFNKITQSVSEIATQKGIDLVLAEQKVEIPENLEQINVDQLKAVIGQRNVLFVNSSAVDITNDVITAMDAKYKAGK
jgi:Skp family chaperone for outer membrane proteins